MAQTKQILDTNIKIFNTLRATLSESFQNRVPVASRENFAEVGTMILSADFQPQFNEWLPSLLNRIGLVVLRDRMLRNKLARFKTGSMEWGDTIEEIGADVVTAEKYQGPELYGENELCLPNPFCKMKPNTVTHFHRRNREEFYTMTIFRPTLKKAFIGQTSFISFVDALVNKLEKSNTADQYLWTKELFSMYINSPVMPLRPDQIVTIPDVVDDATGKEYLLSVKTAIEDLSFNSRNFNPVGFLQYNDPESLILFVRKGLVPLLDVETMAGAFNQSRLESGVTMIVLDDFGTNTANVDAVLTESSFFMIYDNDREFSSIYNPKGRYWNYFLHVWELYATSYFANCIIFKHS